MNVKKASAYRIIRNASIKPRMERRYKTKLLARNPSKEVVYVEVLTAMEA